METMLGLRWKPSPTTSWKYKITQWLQNSTNIITRRWVWEARQHGQGEGKKSYMHGRPAVTVVAPRRCWKNVLARYIFQRKKSYKWLGWKTSATPFLWERHRTTWTPEDRAINEQYGGGQSRELRGSPAVISVRGKDNHADNLQSCSLADAEVQKHSSQGCSRIWDNSQHVHVQRTD